MKKYKNYTIGMLSVCVLATLVALLGFNSHSSSHRPFTPPKGCVFLTVMGEQGSDSAFIYKTPERVETAINRGLKWMATAQQNNGGWGAGSHARQQVMDPHAVATDPATTAMVAMAMLRSGSSLKEGKYAQHLRRALMYLLEAVENAPVNSNTITNETGTQIQTKLGTNIDVILTSQFLSNVVDCPCLDQAGHVRVRKALDRCVQKIQRNQQQDGSISGAGWAGVLQSALANNALETAQSKGAAVDEEVLERSRNYQKENYNAETGETKTERGAGVVLYAVTGSVRASAKEARHVKEEMDKAKKEGKLPANAPATAENLEKIGFSRDEALNHATAYGVYQSAKVQAQRDDVMSGFGSNGGEEFLSYLQTGESMVINKDTDWKNWYDNTCGRLLNIQNNDGSWSGHHCITSPVFCTATCLLILTINNDIQNLTKIGGN